jgi:uncharacterized membrane protein YgcG
MISTSIKSKRLHSDTIEEVKQKADIVEVISEHVALKKRGKDYMGLCPFHDEKTPSFSVSPSKQLYYCFGCNAGGDTVKFLMEFNRTSFFDVVLELARDYSIRVRYEDGSFDEDPHPHIRASTHPRRRRHEPKYLPASIPDGEIELATLPAPVPTPERQHLPHPAKPNVDTWVTRFLYDDQQWVDRIEWLDSTKAKGYDKITLPYHVDCNGEAVNAKGQKPWLPYRWHEVLQHGYGKWVFGLEGETCVETARLLQLVAFTWQGGDWTEATINESLAFLKSAGIAGLFYFPDYDEAGQKKAEKVKLGAALAGLPCVVLNPLEIWAEMPEKGDIVDWFNWARDALACGFSNGVRSSATRSQGMEPSHLITHLTSVALSTAVALRSSQEKDFGGSGTGGAGDGGSRRGGGSGGSGDGGDGGDNSKPQLGEVSLPDRIRSILRRYDSESLQTAALMNLGDSCAKPYSDIEKLARVVRLEDELTKEASDTINPLRALLKTCRKRLNLHRYLARPLADALIAAANAMPTAPEYLLNTLIPVSASRIGVSSRIVIKAESHYIQPCIFWSANVADSGQAKTPPQALIMEALKDMEQEAREAHSKKLADWEAGSDKNKGAKPIETRRILNNTTMAQKIRIHAENPRGLVEYIDELTGDFERHNQHSGGKGDDLRQELGIWNGEFGSYDRGDVRLYLRRTGISKTGTYQWDLLGRLMADEVNFVASGYLARFLLCSIPDAPDRKLDLLSPHQETGLLELLRSLYRRLELLPERDYLLSDEAKVLFQGFNHVIVELDKEEPHFGMGLVYAKIESYAARLALWLHIVNAVVQGVVPSPVISGETMQAAIELASFYLWQHKLIHAHNSQAQKLEGILLKAQTCAEKLWTKGKALTASFAKSRINPLKSWAVGKIRERVFRVLAAGGFGHLEGEGENLVYIPNTVTPFSPCDNTFTIGEFGGIGDELVVPPTVGITIEQVIQTSVGEIGESHNTVESVSEALADINTTYTTNFTNLAVETPELTHLEPVGGAPTLSPTVGDDDDDDPDPPGGGLPAIEPEPPTIKELIALLVACESLTQYKAVVRQLGEVAVDAYRAMSVEQQLLVDGLTANQYKEPIYKYVGSCQVRNCQTLGNGDLVRLKSGKSHFLVSVLPLDCPLGEEQQRVIDVNPKHLVEVPRREAPPAGEQLSFV